MAKEGIDSFLLDCHTNDNLSEIEATFGVKGFAVIVRLWQKIYSEKGYYCEWTDRSPLLFLAGWFGGNSGVDVNFIKEVVAAALRNGIFDKDIYERYSVLTSDGIQRRYFEVVKRRTEVKVFSEYLLVSVDNFRGSVIKKSISDDRNGKNVSRNGTSKVKEREVKGSKGKESNKGFSAEPAEAGSAPPVIQIPLNDGSVFPVTQDDINNWQELYPAVDVTQELRKMKGWCEANPTRKKTKAGVKRFINGWLAKEQDRGRGTGARQSNRTAFDEWRDL